MTPLICGFAKVRNEVLREGGVYRMLANLEAYCDAAVICDDASFDGTAEIVETWLKKMAAKTGRPDHWRFVRVAPEAQDFKREMFVKQMMLEAKNTGHPFPMLEK